MGRINKEKKPRLKTKTLIEACYEIQRIKFSFSTYTISTYILITVRAAALNPM
jgi:hypothetical protein